MWPIELFFMSMKAINYTNRATCLTVTRDDIMGRLPTKNP